MQVGRLGNLGGPSKLGRLADWVVSKCFAGSVTDDLVIQLELYRTNTLCMPRVVSGLC